MTTSSFLRKYCWTSREEAAFSPSNQTTDFSNGDEVLQRIRSNINYEKLAQYVERPKAFERLAQRKRGIEAKVDALKLRLLAKYLIR